MNRLLNVPSNDVFVPSSFFGLDLQSPIKCSLYKGFFNFLILCYLFKKTWWVLQHLVKVDIFCHGPAGHSVGTGSVSGFSGLAAGGRRYSLGALTEWLDSYWNQVWACVSMYISGKGIFFLGGILVDYCGGYGASNVKVWQLVFTHLDNCD